MSTGMNCITSEYYDSVKKIWILAEIIRLKDENHYIISINNKQKNCSSSDIRFVKNINFPLLMLGDLIEYKSKEGWKESFILDIKGKFYYLKIDEDEFIFERQQNIRKVEIINSCYIENIYQFNKNKRIDTVKINTIVSQNDYLKSNCLFAVGVGYLRMLNIKVLRNNYISENELLKCISNTKEMFTFLINQEEDE